MFGRRILVKLNSSYQELGNGIRLKKEVQSRRELVNGVVVAVPNAFQHLVEPGETVVFPFFSANEAKRLGKEFVTVDMEDLEWSEEDGQ